MEDRSRSRWRHHGYHRVHHELQVLVSLPAFLVRDTQPAGMRPIADDKASTSALFGAMTMHAIRGRAAEHQLGLCMVAMRSLATMYTNAEWVRNIFQKLSEKKRSIISHSPSAAPTRTSSPARQCDGRQASLISLPLLSPLASDVQLGPAGSMHQMGYPSPARGSLGVDFHGHNEQHSQGPMLFRHLHPVSHPILPTFPLGDNFESNTLDTDLEVSWRDLACLDSHFNNPFIFSGSFEM